ncbi:TIGR01906 family membrane protein [Pseudarthrobacter sp. B907]|uniref:TIGR01906 family membrane protein n=1 Tax=Pseudarthrobacter sp. B907 TaxID=3158261 RepID=UPI0032DBA539
MTEQSPTPPNRQDPPRDPAEDADEPAFEWMKPAGGQRAAGTTPVAGSAGTTPADGDPSAAPVAGERQGRRAERRAAAESTATATGTAAGTEPAGRPAAGESFNESLPTSALQVRPPREEVERRNAEREQAANAKPVAPRVMQVLLAVFFPVILLVLAVRAVTSPLFLWVEYNRPGFPGDGYGFSTDDRMTYGSYAVDYLSNWSGPRYLGELVNRAGDKLFKDGEVSHMADVKLVILSAFGAGALLVLFSLVAILYLRRRSTGGVRRGLFAGSIATLVVIIGLGVLAVLGWEQFFTEFHRVFFANGTWTFSLQDTLIRLFPGQFWVDAGIVIGALVLLAALLTLILTWPTRKRRGLPPRTAATAGAEAGEAEAGAVDPAALRGRRFKRRNAKAENPAGPDTDAGHDAGTGRDPVDAPAADRAGAPASRDGSA